MVGCQNAAKVSIAGFSKLFCGLLGIFDSLRHHFRLHLLERSIFVHGCVFTKGNALFQQFGLIGDGLVDLFYLVGGNGNRRVDNIAETAVVVSVC